MSAVLKMCILYNILCWHIGSNQKSEISWNTNLSHKISSLFFIEYIKQKTNLCLIRSRICPTSTYATKVVQPFEKYSGSFVRQKRIAIYHVKKFVKDSQLWKQTLSILPDFLENWHFISHFVWKSTKTQELLRIFDELFDVINGEPFLTLYKTSALWL